MLKLTYTEGSFYLEYLTQSPEEWVAQRVILAMRVGQILCVEPSTASFLLPVDLPGVDLLRDEVKRDDRKIITLCACDREYIEVTLRGSWLSDNSEGVMGVFVTTINSAPNSGFASGAEFFLHKLWQEAQACASVMSD